ncbi:inner membrane protein YbjM [Pantoea allii]|uniref:inner membrane protein YbjM n=1 Tax=Pantoea TaxID=53335 RepID=UPI002118E13B|nr:MULTISPECIES: inner membrane protein YbjM [Pantoea]MDJ0034351.1 inner membrane protein YbjM [Pantoea allii]
MPQRYYFWATCLSGGVFYCLVFMFTQDFRLLDKQVLHSQPELLFFLLPGALMALMQQEAPLKSTLIMAFTGTLLAALLLHGVFAEPTRWDYIAIWSLSGMFWAGCGALLVRLLRLIAASRR